jgi:dTDP-4-dehydrorhamnose reductase
MKRIMLTGANGQIGWELRRSLQRLGHVVAFDHAELDLADLDSIRTHVRNVRPDVVVNAGAYTSVDLAESQPDLAMLVNGVAPGVLAEEAKRLGALLVHYSTDYVFDGAKPGPYLETDTPGPLNVYGKSKLAGDRAIEAAAGRHLILRTSWIYGARGKNFLTTILELAQTRDELRVVDDQVGAPTWCRDLAETTAQVLGKVLLDRQQHADTVCGTFNMSAGGQVSWYGFAHAIIGATRAVPGFVAPKLVPVDSTELARPARRPANSVLSNDKLRQAFDVSCRSWDQALPLCLNELIA